MAGRDLSHPGQAEVVEPAPEAGAPVGRRVVLGMFGLGAAGILFGARAQDLLE
ncbi:MAG: hypothetical protein V7605_183, partial [Acidimicrobiaceae bacterium]